MNEFLENRLNITRRHFFTRTGMAIGSMALGSLLVKDIFSGDEGNVATLGLPHFAPKAKRIIYLFQKVKKQPLVHKVRLIE